MIEVKKAEDFSVCADIRTRVFVIEQNVSPELEIDGEDGFCDQYLIYSDNIPVGTFRVRIEDKGVHLQRLAVEKEYRKMGCGSAALDFVSTHYKGVREYIVLDAQVRAIPFYEKNGFEITSDVFMDAGIPHKAMRKRI